MLNKKLSEGAAGRTNESSQFGILKGKEASSILAFSVKWQRSTWMPTMTAFIPL